MWGRVFLERVEYLDKFWHIFVHFAYIEMLKSTILIEVGAEQSRLTMY